MLATRTNGHGKEAEAEGRRAHPRRCKRVCTICSVADGGWAGGKGAQVSQSGPAHARAGEGRQTAMLMQTTNLRVWDLWRGRYRETGASAGLTNTRKGKSPQPRNHLRKRENGGKNSPHATPILNGRLARSKTAILSGSLAAVEMQARSRAPRGGGNTCFCQRAGRGI
jgi:hypothetical protein